jgi:dienelactone hydrolase
VVTVARRRFCQWLGGSGLLAGAGASLPWGDGELRDGELPSDQAVAAATATATGSHLGNLHSFVQQQADRSRFELSFLHADVGVKDLESWQERARTKVIEHLFYAPPRGPHQPEVIRRVDRGDHVQEDITFQTAADVRVPASVLIPKAATLPAPGIVVLHDHGGMYVWGRDKVVEGEDEHPILREFKQQLYGGKSIATELVRRGNVVIAIDMFYWGQRRMLLDDDPSSYRDPRGMTKEEIAAFNRRAGQNEQLVARSLFAAGVTWPGVLLWDDLRTVDYLAARPDVDARRLGCVGLSVGGYRSFLLAALDPRIKVAVDVGWMSSLGALIARHVVNTIGFSFHIIGLYRYLDLPDLAALIAPRSLMVINGSKDQLFPREGVEAAFAKIDQCFRKAGVPDRQRCRLYDAPHQFNVEMQADAWNWVERWLQAPA